MTQNAGIALDAWKIPTFETALAKAGFKYKVSDELINGLGLLIVEVADDELTALSMVIETCQKRCGN